MNLRIIPKIDIKNQNLVKGVHLEGLRALGDPRSFVEIYYKQFADEIIYHDVVASLYQRNSTAELIQHTSQNIFLPLLVGGGITNLKEIEKILKSGADRVFFNTAALNNYNFLKDAVKNFGSSTIVLSIEVVKENSKYFCRKDFGRENTDFEFEDWLKKAEDTNIGEFLITSIDRDGTGEGFDKNLAEIISKSKISTPYILNGGFAKLIHFAEILRICKPSGFAISSMFHYNCLSETHDPDENKDGNFDFKKKKSSFKNFEKNSIIEVKKYLKNEFNIDFRNL
mgnify:CR=1 FL=1|tara:strand:- start:994 stop:1842 length:849 start_codon:yes stop_codon:yes gene_type:complete